MGTYLLGTRTMGWGAWCRAETPYSQDIPPKFLSTTCGCGTSPFCVCAPPPSLDGCGFFNFVVVRLPFNLISDSSEGWLFCISVVMLMWLCKEVSRVYLCPQTFYQLFSFCLFLVSVEKWSQNLFKDRLCKHM